MRTNTNKPLVSILMLTYNAPRYIKKSLKSLALTQNVGYELIVFDNDSKYSTKKFLLKYFNKKMIDKLFFSQENLLFARGNNSAAKLCDVSSKYILLINSDILVKDPLWLEKMLKLHEKGVTSLGFCENPPQRADGFCYLIDKDLYLKYQLNEDFEWWWSITKMQSELLRDGFTVKAVKDHEALLHHFGGKSGKGWVNAKGMDVNSEEVIKWFENNSIKIIESID